MRLKAIHLLTVVLGAIGIGYVVRKRYKAFSETYEFQSSVPPTLLNNSTILTDEEMAAEAYMRPYITQIIDESGEFVLVHDEATKCWLCQQESEVLLGKPSIHTSMVLDGRIMHRVVTKSETPVDDVS